MTTRPILSQGIHYSLPSELYHSAEGVSNSDLKVFSKGADIYLAKKSGVPLKDDGDSEEETKSMILGSLLHLALLEPEKFGFEKSHFIRPATYVNKKGGLSKFTLQSDDCKAWVEAHSSLPIINELEQKRVIGCCAAILRHPIAGPLFAGIGKNEVSIVTSDPETGLTLRMRADRLTPDALGNMWIVDLKSTPDVEKFYFSAKKYRVNVQLSSYEKVAAMAGVENPISCIVAAELKPIHGCHAVRVVTMDERSRDEALKIWRRDLNALAKCISEDHFPPGGSRIEEIKVSTFGQ